MCSAIQTKLSEVPSYTAGDPVSMEANGSGQQEVCIHKWKVYDQEISLLRKNDKLNCLVVDLTRSKSWWVPFEDDTHTISEQIKYLLQCEPDVKDDGSIEFLKPILKWPVRPWNREAKLLRRGDELIWQMSLPEKGEIRSQSFTSTIQCSTSSYNYLELGDVGATKYKLARKSIRAFEKINNASIEDRISFLRDCKILDLSISWFYPSIGVIDERAHIRVGSQPIVKKSSVDPRVLVSRFRWAVTLVCYKGSEGNHAEILVEGVKEGQYFLKVCHFTGITGKEILDDEIPSENLKYEHRTEIWKRDSQKVKMMLEAIKVDKAKPPRLNLWGCDSVFGDGSHNCFTWAREKLEMLDINLGKSWLGFLFARSRNYTYPISSEGPQDQIPIPSDYNIV